MNEDKNVKTAIVNANLIDGTGKEPIENGAVLIEGERIEEKGKKENLDIPEVAKRIDAEGKYLLPGLIDNHVHIFSSGFTPRGIKGEKFAYAGIIAMNNLRSALQAGITTVRDVSSGHVNIAMKTAIERGQLIGPRCFVSGRGICMTGGHGSSDGEFFIGAREVDGPEAIRKAIREEKKAGADFIKVLSSPRSENPEYTQKELNTAVEEAHRFDMKVACHAANSVTTGMASRAGVDTIEHGVAVEEETADLMEENDVGLVPTLWLLNDIKAETEERKEKYKEIGEYVLHEEEMEDTLSTYELLLERLPDSMDRVQKRSVKIGAGTDNVRWTTPFAMLHKELEYLTDYGLSNMGAIRAATKNGAELLGESENLGTIEPGKYADMIMVEENPLEDIKTFENVSWVMKGGKVIPRHPEWRRKPVIDSQRKELKP